MYNAFAHTKTDSRGQGLRDRMCLNSPERNMYIYFRNNPHHGVKAKKGERIYTHICMCVCVCMNNRNAMMLCLLEGESKPLFEYKILPLRLKISREYEPD